MVTLPQRWHRQTERGSSHAQEARASTWDRLKGVVGHIKQKIQDVLRPREKEEKPSPRHVEVGRTAYHFHGEIQGAMDRRGIHLRRGQREISLPLEKDGSLGEDTMKTARRHGLDIHDHVAVRDFPHHRVAIRRREPADRPGTIQILRGRGGLQLQYCYGEGAAPQAFLVTLDDTPHSPVLRLPMRVEQGIATVHLHADAPKGTLERFVYDQCFVHGRKHPQLRAHRMEFAQLLKKEEETLDIRWLAADRYHRHHSPYKNAPTYPELPREEAHSVDISPLMPVSPVLRSLKEVKLENVLRAWSMRHTHLFDAEHIQRIMPGHHQHMPELLATLRRGPASAELQAWLLEHVHDFSISELHALLELDTLLRRERLSPLFSGEAPSPASIVALRQAHINSKDLSLVGQKTISPVGLLQGEKEQIYRTYTQNMYRQQDLIRHYFDGKKLPVSKQEWLRLTAQAELLAKGFPELYHMDDTSNTLLRRTSAMYQTLYRERERLYLLARRSALDPAAHAYILGAFENGRLSWGMRPQDDPRQPVRNACLRLAERCQDLMRQVHTGMEAIQHAIDTNATKPEMTTILDKVYQYAPLMAWNPGVQALPLSRLKGDLELWEINLRALFDKIKSPSMEERDPWITQLEEFHGWGQKIIATLGAIKNPMERRRYLGKIHSYFLIVEGNPLLLSIQLDLFLGALLQEEQGETFFICQSEILRLIHCLPPSWQKRRDLMDVYEILRERRHFRKDYLTKAYAAARGSALPPSTQRR